MHKKTNPLNLVTYLTYL